MIKYVAAILTVMAVPGTASAQSAAMESVQARNLEIVAEFFVPSQPARLTCDMIAGALRNKLAASADGQKPEGQIPGISERKIAAARAYCEANVGAVIARWHDDVKADWSASTKPADIARLVRLFSPSLQEVPELTIDIRPGETATQAARRSMPTSTPEQDARFTRAQAAFARTPGGVDLLNRVSAYQKKLEPEIANPTERLSPLIRDSLEAAHRAGDAYAREKGFEAAAGN